ncbi:hypothetical protein FACS189472_09190 [Alphaproteobacteria bacterium]|nr:hypothetical protein FACS189472_09190 [Alphaproteobacteria bacterium]
MKKLIYSACVMAMMSFTLSDVYSRAITPEDRNVRSYITGKNLPPDVPDGLSDWKPTVEAPTVAGVVKFANRLDEIAKYAKRLHFQNVDSGYTAFDQEDGAALSKLLVFTSTKDWKKSTEGVNEVLKMLKKLQPLLASSAKSELKGGIASNESDVDGTDMQNLFSERKVLSGKNLNARIKARTDRAQKKDIDGTDMQNLFDESNVLSGSALNKRIAKQGRNKKAKKGVNMPTLFDERY